MATRATLMVAVVTIVFTTTSGQELATTNGKYREFLVIPGRLKHVTASTNYIWGVNHHDQIFMCKHPCNGKWRRIHGGLMQVDADDHEVWGVNRAHHIYKRSVDGTGRWKRIGGLLTHVSASGNGYIWGVNKHDQIYKCAKPCNGRWQRVNGALRQIDGGNERVYGVTRRGQIFTRLVDGSGSWRYIPGRLMHITASGSSEVFGVNIHRQLFRCKKPCVGEWEEMSYLATRQVDAANHGLYLTNYHLLIMKKDFARAS